MWSAGKIYYDYVHRPIRFVRRFFAYDGFVQKRVNRWQGKKMREAAVRLKPLPPATDLLGQVHYLTGRSHWHLTVFAAASFAVQTQRAVQPIFHSDGTMDEELAAKLKRVFPSAVCVFGAEQDEILVQHAPREKFPNLNKLWHEFPLMRKLLSVHLWREGWNLCLDSDMLFWRRPDFLMDWLGAPIKPVCMKDFQYAYSASPTIVDQIAGFKVPALINTGVIGMHTRMVDIDLLERYAKHLLLAEGNRHFLEQTMTAMLLAAQGFDFAPPEDYRIPVSTAECSAAAAVCHHYTHESRGWFYQRGWKKVLRMTEERGNFA